MTTSDTRYVLTVLVPDRVGVLCDVTRAIAGFNGNIDAFRQSVVDGLFSLVLTVSFESPPTFSDLDHAIRDRLGIAADAPALLIRHYDAQPAPVPDGSRYIAMIRGVDRPGLLYHISSFLVSRRINIEDWQVEFEGREVIHIGQLTVPPGVEIHRLQSDFRDHLAEAGVNAALCHENIFRATNEIGGIDRLLAETRHD